jgi:hypothetical protein
MQEQPEMNESHKKQILIIQTNDFKWAEEEEEEEDQGRDSPIFKKYS